MTEKYVLEVNKKQFINIKNDIFQDREWWCSAKGSRCAEVIVTALNKLLNENEELKSELKIYRKIANCHNCEFHTYDWYDDGDEFEVCEKGNDMWYRICEEWREFE